MAPGGLELPQSAVVAVKPVAGSLPCLEMNRPSLDRRDRGHADSGNADAVGRVEGEGPGFVETKVAEGCLGGPERAASAAPVHVLHMLHGPFPCAEDGRQGIIAATAMQPAVAASLLQRVVPSRHRSTTPPEPVVRSMSLPSTPATRTWPEVAASMS